MASAQQRVILRNFRIPQISIFFSSWPAQHGVYPKRVSSHQPSRIPSGGGSSSGIRRREVRQLVARALHRLVRAGREPAHRAGQPGERARAEDRAISLIAADQPEGRFRFPIKAA